MIVLDTHAWIRFVDKTRSVTACAALHGAPANRIIVATALYLGASMVTCDEKIRNSGIVKCLW